MPDDQAVPLEPLPAAPRSPDAEHRQLTVLFCDLVGSTALAGQLGLEDYREVVRAYQGACAAVIQRFDGHIAQYLGDGLLAYFGYPQAHEDDGRRAVHAGLTMVEAIRTLNTRLEQDKGIRLAVRVGIHTGLVVVGEVGGSGRHEHLALGETPNVGARLQELATPDMVVISAATYRLVQGLFTCRTLGTHTLKGVAHPLAVYHVLGPSEARSRFEVAATIGLTPLVGREEETGLLRRCWDQAKEGHGQVVLLSGEAGIGKSRLVQELKEHVEGEGVVRTTFRCSPYHQQSALYPVIENLQRVLQVRWEEPPAEKLAKLERVLRAYRFPREEAVPLFAALLSLPPPERYPPLHLSPQRQKQKTLEALIAWLVDEAEQGPVLMVWEDLHWADPSTLELLSLFMEQAATVRVLTLLTFRPAFRPPWEFRPHVTQLTLNRFTRVQVEEMVTRVARGKTLPAEVVQQIVAKTDGVPLFVEELTKMVLESGLLREANDHYELTGSLPALAIPTTLRDSLMARLDRLATVKVVAQLGATLGRQFSYELLQAVSPLDEMTLQHGLRQLVEAELLYQHGVPPQAMYLFKHALIQDAAYQSLLRSTRRQYHRQIAQVLAERFPETAETQPELLAHHYTEAGLTEQAVAYWHRAGRRAYERSANLEAMAHLTKGLELLQALPDTPERTQQELLLQTALGPALMVAKGYAAPEVERAFARARELCQQVGETSQLFRVLVGLWNFYFIRGELQTARVLGGQLLTLAQQGQDPGLLLRAHAALGETLFHLGELVPARAHLEQGIVLYSPQQSYGRAFVQDPRVSCLGYMAWVLCHFGYPDQALAQSHRAYTLAQELSHPLNLVQALIFAAQVHLFRRNGSAAQASAEAVMTLATEQGFPLWLAVGTILRGWALTQQGQKVEGMTQMRQGLTAWRATGAELWYPCVLAPLAEASGEAGEAEAGLRLLAEALALVDKTAERMWEAELYRLKGELLLAQSLEHQTEAEACFQQALAVARRQQAKALELRAATSLSRLWRSQSHRERARQLLGQVYGWFAEGFDLADLQEARALLAALA
jgi:TOMM system kinase/cyclase fusion protein